MFAAITESIPQISQWLPWCHPGYSLADTNSFIARSQKAWTENEHYPFAILDATDGTFLGGIGINHIVKLNQLGNVGYWVRSSRTRRGVAAAAVKLAARYAFGPLRLTRLEIVCVPGNRSSQRVAEKVGARFEAVCRNRVVMHGRPYDAALYGLTPGDMAANNSAGAQDIPMRIEIDDVSRPAVLALLEEHLRNMYELSPPDQVFAFDASKLRAPGVVFWTAWKDAALLGCAALKEICATQGEVKSMRTPARLRGQGAGRALLDHILQVSRERGYVELFLETGRHPAFAAAQSLYRSVGFRECGPFGGYQESGNSVFMSLRLSGGEPA